MKDLTLEILEELAAHIFSDRSLFFGPSVMFDS
jgi:hypothetical protein